MRAFGGGADQRELRCDVLLQRLVEELAEVEVDAGELDVRLEQAADAPAVGQRDDALLQRALADADVDDDFVTAHVDELHVDFALEHAAQRAGEDQGVGQPRGRVRDQDRDARAEVDAEVAATRERERFAGRHLLDVVDRARNHEATRGRDRRERRGDERARFTRVRGDDTRFEIDARVEAEVDGAAGIGAEAARRRRPVVAERAADAKRGLGVRTLAALHEVLGAELVDLGRQRRLAELRREAADERVEVLERQVLRGDRRGRVQLGRLQANRGVVARASGRR